MFSCNPKPDLQIMWPLPKDRFTLKRPFFVIGIDFVGPILFTLVNKGRSRETNKFYISLFICCSKAILI